MSENQIRPEWQKLEDGAPLREDRERWMFMRLEWAHGASTWIIGWYEWPSTFRWGAEGHMMADTKSGAVTDVYGNAGKARITHWARFPNVVMPDEKVMS